MRTALLVIVLVLSHAWGSAAATGCDSASISQWEAERASALEHRAGIEADLERMRGDLSDLSSRIDAEQAKRDQGKRYSRRRIETWLKESRQTAGEMERLSTERSSIVSAISALAYKLNECYSQRLEALLESMLESVRTRDYEAAASHLQRVRELELKIRDLEADHPVAAYPTISEEFIRSSLASFEEHAFLRDTMMDLRERAERDSADAAEKLGAMRRSIGLKRDLMRLTRETVRGGAEASTDFFNEFGEEKVLIEIEELEREETRLEELLEVAVRAIRYYSERIELLNRLVGKDEF